ncbi:MAG: SUF system NifU family Fe-S cluster assembly protein [Armatimonadota bacterium]|nr:SUF system NifU family Fe-S cluster assembly protein [Armatimonadota bacterium]MDR7451389.1 SUF system NifU family Fe-S cluster assembly protein [Armatimonadota bacterium]MDR7466461.1 SUF system NifU family Fe-S cluster assembly protein [Armatimonadota bacterium]MDR7493183.1 SUF system NifU family Fe-S cluster assembly protein [Armatimonadota bacterium]MDR7499464.1 SUF system NifU family Fe-S cluster assembly protein [Armatimonadota bacterium]
MALDDLYRELILDHYSHPRNRGELPDPDIKVEGANPLCGDELAIYVKLAEGRIAEVRFVGRGCSISQASASMMTEQIKGKTLEEARRLSGRFRAWMAGEAVGEEDLGDLLALQGVRKFPVRVKCATLSWVALEQGVDEFQRGKGIAATKATSE